MRLLRLSLLLGALLLLRAGAPEASESAAYLFEQFQAYQRPVPAKLAVCAMIHNERRYLAEWVLYHWVLGFQHFYLYDNESDDAPAEVLAPFVARGLVTLIDWPGAAPQGKQLGHCFNRSRTDVKWMANFDIDEFVVIPGQQVDVASLRSWRQLDMFATWLENDGNGAMLLDRMEYDSNNNTAPPAGLVIANYDSRTISMRVSNVVGKVLVLIRALDTMLSAHDVRLRSFDNGTAEFKKVTADWEPYVKTEDLSHRRPEPLRINHYVARSYSECVAKLSLNRWAAGVDWRKKNGQKMCDQHMMGKPGYVAHEHTKDSTLSSSLLAEVLVLLVAMVEEHGSSAG